MTDDIETFAQRYPESVEMFREEFGDAQLNDTLQLASQAEATLERLVYTLQTATNGEQLPDAVYDMPDHEVRAVLLFAVFREAMRRGPRDPGT